MSFIAFRDALSSSHLWNSRPPAVDRMVFFATAMFLCTFYFSNHASVAVSVLLVVCLILWCILVSLGAGDGREVFHMYLAELKRKLGVTPVRSA
jgi:uncharacterized membrane protein